MDEHEFIRKLLSMGIESQEQMEKIICALIGHSQIVDLFFGQVTCARCGTIIGDTLMGCFDLSKKVIVGHDCEQCKENYKTLTWKDKIYCCDPFEKQ